MPSKTHPSLRVAAVQAAPVFLDLDGNDRQDHRPDGPGGGGGRATARLSRDLGARATRGGSGSIRRPGACSSCSATTTTRWSSARPSSTASSRPRASTASGSSFGYSEKAGGSLYIAQALIDDQGNTVQTRRKLKPTHVERTVFGEGDGSDLTVCETAIGNIGSLCCWEHLQPLSKYAMYSQNEQIHCAAWPSFSLYRGGAYALGAGGQQRRQPALCGRRPVLRDRAVRHGVERDGRDAVHRSEKKQLLLRRRRLRAHLRPRRLAARHAAARGPGRVSSWPTSTSA